MWPSQRGFVMKKLFKKYDGFKFDLDSDWTNWVTLDYWQENRIALRYLLGMQNVKQLSNMYQVSVPRVTLIIHRYCQAADYNFYWGLPSAEPNRSPEPAKKPKLTELRKYQVMFVGVSHHKARREAIVRSMVEDIDKLNYEGLCLVQANIKGVLKLQSKKQGGKL